jgi:4-hydroxy-3-polyprenylbenzoate decarboxylase
VSPAGAQVLRLETGVEVDLDRFDPQRFLAQARRSLAELAGTGTLNAAADSGREPHRSGAGQGGRQPPATPGDVRSEAAAPGGTPDLNLLRYHHYMDWSAGVASGSYLTAGMVICPCSMGTLSAIAAGTSSNLIHRAADVHLKERRPLVLVPRETPLHLIHAENMARCIRAGAVMLPAAPGWYHRPRSLLDMLDFITARVLDQLSIAHSLGRRWGE